MVEHVPPPLKCLPTREMSLQHRASAGAHVCDAFGIRGQAEEGFGKLLRAAGFDK